MFARPVRLSADSAWHGHLPFASWLVQAVRPTLLVELGTHAGVSYAGFCQSVATHGLPTQCFAVDDWTGDDHAGFYSETIFTELQSFHDLHYGAFSRLLRMRFDQALERFADGSVDLLHIDGQHRLEDVSHDYASWLPKLSPHAVVVVHDTNVRERDFGVWRFWAELRQRHPAFEFLHGHGLGVVAPGTAPPAALAPLFAIATDPAATARLRDRFALLGERWEVDVQRTVEQRHRQQLAQRASHADAIAAELHQLRADHDAQGAETALTAGTLAALRNRHDRLRDDLAHGKAERHRLTLELDRVRDAGLAAAAQRTISDTIETGLREQALQLAGELSSAHAAAAATGHATRLAHDAARHEYDQACDRLRQRLAGSEAALAARQHEVAVARAEADLLRRSRSWRLTGPLRAAVALLTGRVGTAPAPGVPADSPLAAIPSPDPAPPHAENAGPIQVASPVSATVPDAVPVPAPDAVSTPAPDAVPAIPTPSPVMAPATSEPATARWRPIRRILFVAGEPGTPGAVYRTERAAAACAAAGYEAETVDVFDVNPDNLSRADLVVLWRAAWSGHIQTLVELAHAAGTRVAFDVDDLIVNPALAVAEIIDGIRTTFVTEMEGRSYFRGMQRTLTSCDLCTTTTAELAEPAGVLHPIVHVLPNSFAHATERASRRAVRIRAEQATDGHVRLGYAGGTRTHQKDFATIAASLAHVLEHRPETLLVLFRDPRSGEGLVLIEEFPELASHADRIEWRDMVPLAELPAELARFDVSLCPLEQGNPFCEAKSELKYFESALAGVCVVATPTGPFRRAVRDGVTGFLPADTAAWTEALLMLVDDPKQRARVARAACHDVLWQFGPRRQTELWAQLLQGLDGGASGARASELGLRRGAYRASGLPEIPDSTLLYSHDALGEARVTIGMTSYNYEAHIGEALASVLAQTLASIDLVVVDDGSSDGSVALVLDWAERNRMRFNRVCILATARNAGLGGARNLVFDQAETPWIMVLDSDNRLRPEACERLLLALDEQPLAAFAYPRIRQFGAGTELMGTASFDPSHLASGNYIDAMVMVAKWAWAAGGGYYVRRDAMGWEDFSLWCRLVELGQFGIAVPHELAEYRVHAGSMVNAITEQDANKRLMVEFVEARHPWLRLRMRSARQRH